MRETLLSQGFQLNPIGMRPSQLQNHLLHQIQFDEYDVKMLLSFILYGDSDQFIEQVQINVVGPSMHHKIILLVLDEVPY